MHLCHKIQPPTLFCLPSPSTVATRHRDTEDPDLGRVSEKSMRSDLEVCNDDDVESLSRWGGGRWSWE